MIFTGNFTESFHNLTMDEDPGFIKTEKFRGGVQFYMMSSKDFV